MDARPRAIGPREVKRRLAGRGLAVLAGLGLLAAGLVMFVAKPVEVRITEAQAQAALDGKLGQPVRGALGATVTPARLSVDFRADDRVAVDSALVLEGLGQSARADGTLLAGLRYDSPYVFLRDIDASGLEVRPAGETRRRMDDIVSVLGDRFRRDETEPPEEPDEAARGAFDRLAGDLAVALAGTVPVYDLRDAGLGGSVAALALQDVRFESDAVVLTLSSRAALLRILGFIAIVALVLLGGVLYLLPQAILGWLIDRWTPDFDPLDLARDAPDRPAR